MSGLVAQWPALLHHSMKVLGSNPPGDGAFLVEFVWFFHHKHAS